MEKEAIKAETENEALVSEMKIREVRSKHMMVEQHSCYEQLRRLRIEQEVIGATADIQEQKLISCDELEVKQKKYVQNILMCICLLILNYITH